MSEETQKIQEKTKQEVGNEKTDISSSFSGNKNNIEEKKQMAELEKQMLLVQKQLEEQKKDQESRGFGNQYRTIQDHYGDEKKELIQNINDCFNYQNERSNIAQLVRSDTQKFAHNFAELVNLHYKNLKNKGVDNYGS